MTGKKQNKKSQNAPSGEDKREETRIPVQMLVDYKCDGNYLFDFCRDLGAGGIFIETKDPIAIGETIDCTFTLPDSKKTLAIKGEILWHQGETKGDDGETQPAGMGVQFCEYTEEQQKVLRDFVTRFHGDKWHKAS